MGASIDLTFAPDILVENSGWFNDRYGEHVRAPRPIELEKISFLSPLRAGEPSITAAEAYRRLAEMRVALATADTLRGCWRVRDSLPEPWKTTANGQNRRIYILGSFLKNPEERRFCIVFAFHDGEWRCGTLPFDSEMLGQDEVMVYDYRPSGAQLPPPLASK